MKTGIKKRERERENVRKGEEGAFRPNKGGDGGGCLFKHSPEENFRGGEERAGAVVVGRDGRAWKTATSHRHRSSQETPRQTDIKNPTYCEHNSALSSPFISTEDNMTRS